MDLDRDRGRLEGKKDDREGRHREQEQRVQRITCAELRGGVLPEHRSRDPDEPVALHDHRPPFRPVPGAPGGGTPERDIRSSHMTASSSSLVATMTIPFPRCSLNNVFIVVMPSGSRLVRGSSRRSSPGRSIHASAYFNRCFIPDENVRTTSCLRRSRDTIASISSYSEAVWFDPLIRSMRVRFSSA